MTNSTLTPDGQQSSGNETHAAQRDTVRPMDPATGLRPTYVPTGIAYERKSVVPKPSLLSSINWRIVVFAAIAIAIPGSFFYVWVHAVMSGGIYKHGEFSEVDLKAMSNFDMDQQNATMDDIPQRFRALEGKKVIMTGEMWAPSAASDGKLSYFQLVYSKTKCCFSGPPLAQHFVDGNVKPGVTAYYYDVPVKVYGTVHISIDRKGSTDIKSIYHVDVDKVEPIEG